MRVPEVADELRELAVKHNLPRLAALADELPRRRIAKRTPNSANPMTDEIAEEIRRLKKLHPNESQLKIANRVGVNQGRVSEVLSGKRT